MQYVSKDQQLFCLKNDQEAFDVEEKIRKYYQIST